MRTVINKLIAKFMRNNWHRDPYKIGAQAFREWYATHLKDEPIPEDMVPTEEEYKAWDQEMNDYVIAGLRQRFGYAELREIYPDYAWGGALCQGDGQCSFDCEFWRNCSWKKES